jgi:ElaB/YqjD/DUF883 family membrane-anchored ribosome-binding protein
MDNETEVIRQQMEETRSSLTDKLETLEQQVVDTVETATSAVTDTVENVKEAVQDTVATVKGSVQETVEGVKHTFDLRLQVDRHPWAMMAGSVALGFFGGRLLKSATTGEARRLDRYAASAHGADMPEGPDRSRDGARGYEPVASASRRNGIHPPRLEAAQPSFLSELGDKYESEIGKLKKLAIGTALAVVRDAIQPSIPEQMKSQVIDVINSVTTKLGGEVIEGPILREPNADALAEASGKEKPAPAYRGRPAAATLW